MNAQATAKAEVQSTPSVAPAAAVAHSMWRRAVARRLTESKQQVPHFYVRASCRIDALQALRQRLSADGEKVSLNDCIVRAVALALREVPQANVGWTDKEMLQFTTVDVAVAVATPKGLVTPIVRAVESKSIPQISQDIRDLAARGRTGRLRPEEYQGGQVSVSNLGMYGVEEFSAILNPPQSAIFAIGAGEQRAVVVDGQVQVATVMSVTASFDHRAIDGSVGGQLMAAFKRLVEQPESLVA
jgi:pyruvate dehydrogenase E2 component (dihydrolipoyllysine-residue acetyltransferase)